MAAPLVCMTRCRHASSAAFWRRRMWNACSVLRTCRSGKVLITRMICARRYVVIFRGCATMCARWLTKATASWSLWTEASMIPKACQRANGGCCHRYDMVPALQDLRSQAAQLEGLNEHNLFGPGRDVCTDACVAGQARAGEQARPGGPYRSAESAY